MKITHLQSATQIIDIGDVKLLTDPWLTDAEYYGSWYHYPPFNVNDIDNLEYDCIYVSHIHPDHLSESTFKSLPKKVPVLIHNYESKFVRQKLKMLGFETIECDHGVPFYFDNGGSVTIYAADNCNPELCYKFMGCAVLEKKFGSTQIDTLALFEYEGKSILNTNDCPYELAETTITTNSIDKKQIDALLVGYGGAGPYPQCFKFENHELKLKAAKDKEIQFLNQAIKYIEKLNPKSFIPFAGNYVLGSRLAPLTELRGVPSLQKALEYISANITIKSEGVLLQQLDVFDMTEMTKIASKRKHEISYEKYVDKITKNQLTYDDDQWDDSELPSLIDAAHNRFQSKAKEINFISDTDLIIETEKISFVMRINSTLTMLNGVEAKSDKFVKISLHHNLLHRLLRGPRYAHWNNAEIGSHLSYARQPNVFERGLYHSLCFFHS